MIGLGAAQKSTFATVESVNSKRVVAKRYNERQASCDEKQSQERLVKSINSRLAVELRSLQLHLRARFALPPQKCRKWKSAGQAKPKRTRSTPQLLKSPAGTKSKTYYCLQARSGRHRSVELLEISTSSRVESSSTTVYSLYCSVWNTKS